MRYARSQLTASTTYVSSVRQSVGRSLLAALEPYWGSMSWEATVSLLTRQAACWLPSLPAAGMPSAGRQLHFFLLNALNALGQHLPVTLALTVAELARSSRTWVAAGSRCCLLAMCAGCNAGKVPCRICRMHLLGCQHQVWCLHLPETAGGHMTAMPSKAQPSPKQPKECGLGPCAG